MKAAPRLSIFLVLVFLISLALQSLQWREFGMLDSAMWGSEARYVQQHDPREFNFLEAYGHPGGPIIESGIVLHSLFGTGYEFAVILFVIVSISVTVTLACALCYALRQSYIWCTSVAIILSFSWLYYESTPPSSIVSPLVVLLSLLTLYVYERSGEPKNMQWSSFAWAAVSGLCVATRADIGIFLSAIFILLLVATRKVSLLRAGLMALCSFIVFVVFDPFMWTLPLHHLHDLVYKMTYHYADFTKVVLPFSTVVAMSALTVISMGCAGIFVLAPKRFGSPLPKAYITALFLSTLVLYCIFLSAHSQATRYFMPIVFIWEVFLPLYIFSLLDRSTLSSQNRYKYAFVALLFGYQLVPYIQSLWIFSTYHLLP